MEDPPRVWMASSRRLAAWVGGPEMGRQFRTLAALTIDLSLVSSPQQLTAVAPVPENETLSSGFHGHQAYVLCTDIHARKLYIHKKGGLGEEKASQHKMGVLPASWLL